jgi:hypothetical protein
MIRQFLADAWSRLWRGEPLDVYVGPVAPPQKALDAVREEYARHQAETAADATPEPAPEPERDEAPIGAHGPPIPKTNYEATAGVVEAAEDAVLAELAAESAQGGVSPWEAAQAAFGHAPVRKGVEWRLVSRRRG